MGYPAKKWEGLEDGVRAGEICGGVTASPPTSPCSHFLLFNRAIWHREIVGGD
jgi:hypothetical protein